MRVRLDEEVDVAVQMAPLIDCVFLLLIFFLVATTLKKIEKELPLDLPEASAAVGMQLEDNMTIVSVDREGNLYLGSEPVGQGYLMEKLREAAQRPGHRIRIDADREAPVWAAVQVLDMCEFEGLGNVGIKTKQAPEFVSLP
jgi:biopolymer transport protein ExbD